jgi:putative Flp pilus-assembly TadE/G-like protein
MAIFMVLILCLFLLAALGFAVDYTNIWFQRQQAQTAADAACQAGILDVYQIASGAALPNMGFAIGTAGNCNAFSSGGPSMCWYAAKNGFSGYSAASADVSWSFPGTVPGINTSPPATQVPFPFMRIKLTVPVKTYFATLLTGSQTQQVGAITTCAINSFMGGDVVLALNPHASGAFTENGTGTNVQIVGGAGRGIQVNSDSSTAVVTTGGSTTDLSEGGPNYTGSDFGVTGGPAGQISGFDGGTTGHWAPSDIPVGNPYAALTPPVSVRSVTPVNGTNGKSVPYHLDGCPDPAGCQEFWPGYYPSGISATGGKTALMNMGIYYMDGDLKISGGSTLRPTIAAPGQLLTNGTMFYFHTGTIKMTGAGNPTIDPTPSSVLTCDGSAPPPALGIPSGLSGHVLYGQCTKLGTYYDAGGDTTDSIGAHRGLLFYQDPSNTDNSPSINGGSGMALAGNIYVHSSSYADTLTITGGSGVFAGTWGSIIADQLKLTGGSKISMLLNPNDSVPLLKVALVQ